MDDPGIALRKLAIHDDAYIEAVLAHGLRDTAPSGLDARTLAMVRIGALGEHRFDVGVIVNCELPESGAWIVHGSIAIPLLRRPPGIILYG